MRSFLFISKTLFLLLFCLLARTTEAQQYQNEWINYSLPYYKFKIAQDGLYKINQATLAAGQMVRQVSAQELGPLRLGRNVSLFEWNGKDAAGHALSSGTYVCRLVSVGTSDENLPYVKKGSLLVLAQGKIILHR
jgi:hypothetical protein